MFCLLVLHLSFCRPASAQQYSVAWHKIAGGGGTSSGGQYTLNGTIGQHDAGSPASGGRYSLTGGFWSIYAVQTPGAPSLRIFLTNGTAVVAWSAPSTGWTLQQNTNMAVAAGWVNTSATINAVGGENQIIVSAPTGNRFYRLFHP